MNVGVVALPACWDSGITAMLDVLRASGTVRHQVDRDLPAARALTVAATSSPVPTAGGLLVPVDLTFDDPGVADLDVLVVPALAANGPIGVVDALLTREARELRKVLREWAADGRQLAAACTGTVLLAEAGLLDRRRATTSWWLEATFRHRYPQVALDMSQMLVKDGTLETAGAAFAHIDLALSLVSRLSPQLAKVTASALLIEERPSHTWSAGTPAERPGGPSGRLIADFEEWVRHNLARDIGVADAAAALGTTRRTLERRIRQEMDTTPYSVIQRLRVERADHLRRTSRLGLTQIAPMVGYRDVATLRSLLNSRPKQGS